MTKEGEADASSFHIENGNNGGRPPQNPKTQVVSEKPKWFTKKAVGF